ncbi:hypothetical protein [Emticicia sp. 17c]|uniref:hypothetical protein n=1 Tax=Emticicia sp. 17c TaxID=3127704 RepID=UPI00301DB42E
MSPETFDRIITAIDAVLRNILIQDAANSRVGGVSVTALQKQLLATLATHHESEQVVLRKILQGILNQELGSLATQAPPAELVSAEQYEALTQQYNELAKDYQAIFTQAGSDHVVVIPKATYNQLTATRQPSYRILDEDIYELIRIVTEHDDDDQALQAIKAYLNADE